MPSLREHLDSPQFEGEDPLSEEEIAALPGLSRAKFTGGWVAPGTPRWKAYTIYIASIIGGIFLAIPTPGSIDFITYAGLAFVAFGIFGTIETLWGKRLWHR